ncbi:MAG: hypothetical protein ACRD40_12310 [Candidatus Acidiferrales bacterium]
MNSQTLKESLTDAIRYWELRRLAYNAILALIVIAYFWMALPNSKQGVNADFVLGLFLLVVIANVAYCAEYIADIFAQMSDFRDIWRRTRWILFMVGTLFAGVIHDLSRWLCSQKREIARLKF